MLDDIDPVWTDAEFVFFVRLVFDHFVTFFITFHGTRSPGMLRNTYGRLGNICYSPLHMVGRFRKMAAICVT